jgi:hypothetical protein
MIWSEMTAAQRVTCVAWLVPALMVYGVVWTYCRVSNAVGLE